MFHPDHPARLRELAGQCRRAAAGSYELESKMSFRGIGERLSSIADEIEQSDGESRTFRGDLNKS